MNEPRVSIILPTFNRGDVIRRAIDSVLAQSFTDWELVIIDDGSSDGTADAVSGIDPRIVVVRQQNSGVYVARNTGLSNARGRLITFLDSDDDWTPYYLELAVGFLDRHPDEHVVTTEFYEAWGTKVVTREDHDGIREQVCAPRAGARVAAVSAARGRDRRIPARLRVARAARRLGATGARQGGAHERVRLSPARSSTTWPMAI